MSTKAAIISTIAIFVGTMVLSIVILVVFIKPTAANANRKASELGQSAGLVSLLPIGGVWIAWAARKRKEREQDKK